MNICRMLRRVLALAALTSCVCAGSLGETLRIYPGPYEWNDGVQAFRQRHPDLTLEGVPVDERVFNTSEFVGKLITREYSNDVFEVSSFSIDYRPIMEKGYCLDLSGSQALQDAVARMHPVIAQEAFLDGKLLGLPMRVFFDYLVIQPKGWEAAGYDSEDVPQSYPELLALLEEVCDRMEGGELENFRVYSGVALTSDEFTPMTYASYFATWLLTQYQLQCQLAETLPDFTNPELTGLMERTVDVSRRLYDLESYLVTPDGDGSLTDYSLITMGNQQSWPAAHEEILFLRLNDTQPRVVCSYLEMMMVYTGTQHPDEAIEYLEALAPYGNMQYISAPTLYKDAEPILKPEYEKTLAIYQERVAAYEARLAQDDLSRDEREEAEEKLVQAQADLEEYDTVGKYAVTQEQIDSLARHVDELAFLYPGPLTAGTEIHIEYVRLEQRFKGEQLDACEFLQEVNELYQRIAREDGS